MKTNKPENKETAEVEPDETEQVTRCYRHVNQLGITPGPWEWFCNAKTKSIYLATPDRGRLYVMGFERYGMQRAAPSFCNNDGELRIIKRADRWGTTPDHNGYYDIDNPDAKLIAAAPDLYEALISIQENCDELNIELDHMVFIKMENALKKAAGIDVD